MRKERRNPFRSSLRIEPAWRRWGLGAVSVVVYAAAFLPLYAETGVGVSALALFPVVILGWLFGAWGGLLAGLLAMPANALLLGAVGEPGWRMVTGPGGLEGSALVVVVGAVIGLLRDLGLRLDRHLTEWRKAERALRAAEDRYRILFERSRDAMYVSRPDGVLVAANDAFLRLVGRDRDALEGLRAQDLYENPADRDRLLREIGRTGWVEDHPVRLVRDDGTVRDCLLTAGARYQPGAQRTVAEIQGSIRTVAEDRALHALATRRTHELQDVVGELEAFTYSVSHDLRRHLVTMGGFASMLWADYGDELDPRARDFLERIMAASRRMDAFVQDLVDYSRIGKTPVEATRVELDDVVREALDRLAAHVAERNAEIEVAPELPAVEADRALVLCVLEKLVANAVTFVPEGRRPHVDIDADVEERRIRLKVRDNGVGIPADRIERVFRAFERLEPGRFPGTGLGLTVVEKAVVRMGGEVGVRSVAEGGSTFWVVLPAALPPELDED